MPEITLAISLVALVLSLFAFAGATIAAVTVIGWKSSTHQVVTVPAANKVTEYSYDAPQEVLDRLPQSPEPLTPQEYARQSQSSLEDFYRAIGEE